MWQKTPEELRKALTAPFANGDIEWRVSVTSKDKERGLAVPYVTNRAIQNRLDDTVGVDGWRNEFVPWKNDTAQLCGISIYFPKPGQWLTKWDGADDSDIESVKGGLSDSMKRAAVEWGIGRYLYGMTQVWVRIEQRGKGYAIADGEREKLDKTHEAWVAQIQKRSGPSPQNGQKSQGSPQNQTPPPAPQQKSGQAPPHSGTTTQPQDQRQAPRQSGQGQAPRQQQSQPRATDYTPPSQGQQVATSTGIPEGCFQVQGAVLKPTLSNGQRLHLQLLNSAGQPFQAFLRGQPDGRLSPGTLLENAEFTTKSDKGVTFYVLERYQIMDGGFREAA